MNITDVKSAAHYLKKEKRIYASGVISASMENGETMSKEKQIEGYLTTKLKPKNKINCIAWLLLNVFGCKFCETCRDKRCNLKDGESCTDNIANYIREAVKEEAGYRRQSEGEWIEYSNWAGSIEYKCTACGESTFHAICYAYCPHCGAKMKGGD